MTKKPLTTAEQNTLNRQLGEAAIQNNIRQIEKCINSGAEIDALSIPKGIYDSSRKVLNAPLHEAVCKGNLQAVKILLENGADVDVFSTVTADTFHNAESGSTPLHDAAFAYCKNNKEIIDLLLAAGADVYVKSASGESAGDLAIRACKGRYLESIANDPSKRPTPQSVGLDINKRNAALIAMGKLPEDVPEVVTAELIEDTVPKTTPKTTLTPEEIIKRMRDQARENDEGI